MTELVIMNQSSDKPFASRQEMEMNKRKQSSSAQDDVFTRVIHPSDGLLANLVGRDSGIGSTFGATSADPESISATEQLQELQSAESLSINDSSKETESGSSCSSAVSQQTVRPVQPSNTLPSDEFHKPNVSFDHSAGHSKISSPSNEHNFFSNTSNSDVLYMAGHHFQPYEPSYSSSVGLPVQEFQGSKDTGCSNPNSLESVSVSCSYSCNDHINAKPSDDDLDDIVIEPWEYKEEFRESQFDIVLIYSENDRDQALAFRDILTRYIVMEDNKHPSICVLDQSTHLAHINSRFIHMEEALKRSTFMFLFVTKDFCVDSWSQLQRDECLMESINNPEKKWCVVPILTKPRKEADYTLPFGIRALKGVEIYQMLCGKDLKSVKVDTLKEGDVDQYFCNNMRKMLSTRLSLKKQRERQQLVEFQKWLKEEKQRRWKTKQEELLQHFLNEKRRAEERAAHQKKCDDLKQQELAMMKDAANKKAATEADMIMKNMRMKENAPYHPHNIETRPFTSKPTMNETPVVHHHYYYSEVTQTSDKHTTYNIHGPVKDCTIGDENKLNKVMRLNEPGTALEETNLETDSPTDSIEYIVEVEENPPCQPADCQQEGLGSARATDNVCTCPEPVDEMISAADQRSPAAESHLANLTFLEKSEVSVRGHGSVESAKCSPEVDNPLSLHCERNAFDISKRFSNESSSPERPMAAIAPIRQISEIVPNTEEDTVVKLPFNEVKNYGETVEKPKILNEESRLKHVMVMPPGDNKRNDGQTALESQYCAEDTDIKEAYSTNITPKADTETSMQQTVKNTNRSYLPGSALETDESFVVVERTELTPVPRSLSASANQFVKKKVQTDGLGKVKSLATGNKLPGCHEGCSSEPCLSALEKGTDVMMMDENFYEMEKVGGAGLVRTCPSAGNLGLSSSSTTSANSSPSPTKKNCVLS